MSNRNRSLARRKAQNDQKARVVQEAKEKNAVAKKDAAAQQEMETEVRKFTEAETRAYAKKMKVFNEAAAAVNEFLEFLKEQHDINTKEGWKLGDGCFVRQVPKATTPPTPAPDAKPPKATKPATAPAPSSRGTRPSKRTKTPAPTEPDDATTDDPTVDETQPVAEAA